MQKHTTSSLHSIIDAILLDDFDGIQQMVADLPQSAPYYTYFCALQLYHRWELRPESDESRKRMHQTLSVALATPPQRPGTVFRIAIRGAQVCD